MIVETFPEGVRMIAAQGKLVVKRGFV